MSVASPDCVADYPLYSERFRALNRQQQEAVEWFIHGVQNKGQGELEMRFFENGSQNWKGKIIYFSIRDLVFAALKGTHLGNEWLKVCVNLYEYDKENKD